ncbi:unnamed protein product [Prunus armeniaca]
MHTKFEECGCRNHPTSSFKLWVKPTTFLQFSATTGSGGGCEGSGWEEGSELDVLVPKSRSLVAGGRSGGGKTVRMNSNKEGLFCAQGESEKEREFPDLLKTNFEKITIMPLNLFLL